MGNKEQRQFDKTIKARRQRELRMRRRAYLEHLSGLTMGKPMPKLAPDKVKKSWWSKLWEK